jgi:glutamate-ammonia-ligase adenylyltransferase
MLEAHGSKSEHEFDLKQDRGGIIDVEFIVQFLVLGHAHDHRQLTGNLGNIALLRIAGELGLIPPDAAAAAGNAYREYRRLQHAQRLSAEPHAGSDRESLEKHIAAVNRLWHTVLGEPA